MQIGIKSSFPQFLVYLKELRSETLSESKGTLELQRVQRSCKTDLTVVVLCFCLGGGGSLSG